MFAYSNGSGQARSLVVYHNRYAETSGWVRESAAYAVKEGDGSKRLVRRTLADGLGIGDGSADDRWLVFREQRSGLEHLRSVAELRERGLHVQLHAYETLVFWEMRELYDSTGVWRRLAERLGGRGVASLEGALRELQLSPVHDALRAVIADPARPTVERFVAAVADATGTSDGGAIPATVDAVAERAAQSLPVVDAIEDPSQAAALRRVGAPRRRWACWPRVPRSDRRAGPGSRSCGWPASSPTRCAPVASTRRPRGRPPSACTCSWTCRSPPSVDGPTDGRAARLVEAWLEHPVVRGLPPGQRLGRRRVVQPRVVGRARRVGGPHGAGAHPGRRPRGPARGAEHRRAGADRGGRGVGLSGRRAAGGAGRRGRDAGLSSTPRLPKATGLPKGPVDRAKPAATTPRPAARRRGAAAGR